MSRILRNVSSVNRKLRLSPHGSGAPWSAAAKGSQAVAITLFLATRSKSTGLRQADASGALCLPVHGRRARTSFPSLSRSSLQEGPCGAAGTSSRRKQAATSRVHAPYLSREYRIYQPERGSRLWSHGSGLSPNGPFAASSFHSF